MTMEVTNGNIAIDVNKNVKAIDANKNDTAIDANKNVKANVNLKRKRANKYAAYITAFAASLRESDPSPRQASKRIKTDVQECSSHEFEHCSGKVVLQDCGNCYKKCSEKLVLLNNGNFRKSSVPMRVMYFLEGEWNDFPENALAPLKDAFQSGKSVADVSIDSSSYLVDFLRMVMINLKNGMQSSIAWIDENGKCFSPTYVVEGSCRFKGRQGSNDKCVSLGSEKVEQLEVKVEIGISGTESPKSENSSEFSVSHAKSLKFQAQVLHTDSSESEHNSSDTQNQCRVFPSGQLKEVAPDNGAGDVTAVGPLSKDLQFGQCMGTKLSKESESEHNSSDTQNQCRVFPSGQLKEVALDNGAGDGKAVGPLSKDLQFGPCMGTNRPGSLGYGMLAERLVKVAEGDSEFLTVQNRFLAGVYKLVTDSSIVGIYRVSPLSGSAKARLQAFQNHVEITREFRGNANVLYAWHGTSQKCVSGIIVHGFGPSQVRTPKGGAAYGTGVYLTPEDCLDASAAYSDVDENGEQHVVLCRVILGNMEEVKPGSQQFHPSNENFDSGADSIKCPKCYVIWTTHMNTHIHPEYVVSFKVSLEVREYWAGLRTSYGSHGVNDTSLGSCLQRGITCEKISFTAPYKHGNILKIKARIEQAPFPTNDVDKKLQGPADLPVKATSAWIFFPVLFSVIGKHLSSSDIDSLERCYADFKKKRLTRGDLIKRIRMIAGDQLVVNAVKYIQSQKIGMQCRDELEDGPCSRIQYSQVHPKNSFAILENETSVFGIRNAEFGTN